MNAEKHWLRSTLYVILKSNLKDHEKVIKIMEMVEAYEAMKEVDGMNQLSDIAKETFGLD